MAAAAVGNAVVEDAPAGTEVQASAVVGTAVVETVAAEIATVTDKTAADGRTAAHASAQCSVHISSEVCRLHLYN